MAAYAVEVKRMDKDYTFGEIIAQMEELAREFIDSEGDVQRGFEILRAFLQLNGQREF
jgi:hypothetical protein